MLRIARDVEKRIGRLTPVEIVPDLEGMSPADLKVLSKIVEAGRYIDKIFLRQAYSGNPKILDWLRSSSEPLVSTALRYFALNIGPWDKLSEFEPYIGGMSAPRGAGFYPEDMTKKEFEVWVRNHPKDAEKFRSLYTMIRRGKEAGRRREKKLVAIPYSVEFREFLEPAAELLRNAADNSMDRSLARFLRSRAEALLTDDYFESDLDWMDLDSEIEPTFGPYEEYNDRLFGYKASYELFLSIRDREASGELELFTKYLDEMEKNLPLPDEYKNKSRGKESPVRVVNQIFAAGDARGTWRAAAYNLPNDERVREAKGSKKILLKNIMEAQFQNCWIPIRDRVIAKNQAHLVTFKAGFYLVLFHELAHGLGPGNIILPNGKKEEVRLVLKELFAPLEEGKADMMGLWNLLFMISKNLLPQSLENEAYVTCLEYIFSALRLGVQEAHGRGSLVQLNYFMEKGAVRYDRSTGRYSADIETFKEATRSLLHDMLMVQAKGNYNAAQRLFNRYGKVPTELKRTLAGLAKVPVDIIPIFRLPFPTSWDVNSLP